MRNLIQTESKWKCVAVSLWRCVGLGVWMSDTTGTQPYTHTHILNRSFSYMLSVAERCEREATQTNSDVSVFAPVCMWCALVRTSKTATSSRTRIWFSCFYYLSVVGCCSTLIRIMMRMALLALLVLLTGVRHVFLVSFLMCIQASSIAI